MDRRTAREAFLALAPFETEEDAAVAAGVYDEPATCASHDAYGCPLCGWSM
jgi:hypothetical protein